MVKQLAILVSLVVLFFSVSAQGNAVDLKFRTPKLDSVQYGTASFYSDKFEGKKTSSGDIFRQKGMTCAHNSLPMGTWVRITNLRNEKNVMVKVTDRLHHRNSRLVDLSSAAAKILGYTGKGLAKVRLEVLGKRPENEEIN